MNKEVANEIAVGVIVLIVVIVGGVFWMQSEKQVANNVQPVIQVPVVQKEVQPQQQTQQVKPVDEAVNWQAYENEKFGFKFKYPNNLETEQNMNVDYFSLSIGNKVRPTPSSDYFVDSTFLMEVKKTNFKDINSWFFHFKKDFEKPSNYEGYIIHPIVNDVENFKIDNLDAKKYIPNEGTFPFYDRCVVFIKSGFEYSFCYSGVLNDDEKNLAIIKKDEYGANQYDDNLIESIKNGYREKFDLIISTIKFTKKDETAN